MAEILENKPGEYDVRSLIPIERHRKLIALFKALALNDSFIFINDHDPIPLYYELKSIHGDVLGWEYLKRGGRDWKVKVTRTEDSTADIRTGIETIIDLNQTDQKKQRHVVFHRFGMLEKGQIMELRSDFKPQELLDIFEELYRGKYIWGYKTETPGEYIIHLEKTSIRNPIKPKRIIDLRPEEPTVRHDLFYQAFADLQQGESFAFYNDHDPSPLYYQMKATDKTDFDWEYFEKGPDVWKVCVSRPLD